MNTTTAPAKTTTVRIETMGATSRCREFTARGRQCANYTTRVVVVERESRPDVRFSDCGRHK